MHKRTEVPLTLVLLLSAVILIIPVAPVIAQDVYLEETLCTIPWGDEIGMLDCTWRNQLPSGDGEELMWAAGEWIISDSDELIILNHGMNVSRGLMKFDTDGSLMAFTDMQSVNMQSFPTAIAVASTGEVVLGHNDQIRLLNPTLELIGSSELSEDQAAIHHIYPSDHGSFWIVYRIYGRLRNYWMLEYSTDGNMSTPQLLFQGVDFENCAPCSGYLYVAPDGNTYRYYTDKYGYTYKILALGYDPNLLSKESPTGEVVFTHPLISDPGWTDFDTLSDSSNCCITWSGDFYTLHASAEGAVLTKYDLNDPPVCHLFIVTSMPYRGPSPADIEFDATGSYDPDPCDELTFEWDFDGDHIYGEPVDDAYTGDPDNPTHSYTEDYIGVVNLKLTDNHGAESYCLVTVEVDII